MRARLRREVLATREGREAEAILRSCVHCGFCNATCPTYQLLGDERDGPRGRIYQIKSLLEGLPVTTETATHLDRCLTCRACETTCPSGVQYGRLLDYARPLIEEAVPRPPRARLARWLLRKLVPSPLFAPLLAAARAVRGVLPAALAAHVPAARAAGAWPAPRHASRWLAFDGCVQEAARPSINAAAARVFDRAGLSLLRARSGGCCGALAHHLGAHDEALACARRNVDAWTPALDAGAAGIFCASSGCSTMLKDYGRLLADDPDYAARAQRVAAQVRDSTEFIAELALAGAADTRVAVQAPCSLQHGLRGAGRLEAALSAAGCRVQTPAEAHLCCGSAGSYSLLQPALSAALRQRKLEHLGAGDPAAIATSNIGCLLHLEAATALPVRHWLEIVDRLQSAGDAPPRFE
ncbi:MAG TPA: glycolate oxidase subunit GlcF [Gammaproteobacteria bacterium]|nr:glycolate oxidase subunit GlcF [Gammaproteobacteria bacterium]